MIVLYITKDHYNSNLNFFDFPIGLYHLCVIFNWITNYYRDNYVFLKVLAVENKKGLVWIFQ